MKEKFLPIGTVCTLDGGTKRVMIIGFCPMTDDNRVFDYSACTFPEGIISSDKTLAFNHEQIVEVNFMGLEDAEQAEFNQKIKEMLANVENLKNMGTTEQTVTETAAPAVDATPAQPSVPTGGDDIPVLNIIPNENNAGE